MRIKLPTLPSEIEVLIPSIATTIKRPYFAVKVNAGFPSPADDYMDRQLDLNEHLIHHPEATFFVRVIGNSMINAGIHEGDLLIVDKSLEAKTGSIVIAVINGEFTVKRLKLEKDKVILIAENHEYKAIEVSNEEDFQIWGVVTNVIHSCL